MAEPKRVTLAMANVTVDVPEENVDLVFTVGTPCSMTCDDNCREMQEQFEAMVEGWA
ncbi:MAG TPA: hypothetical protein PL000_22695 [Anaerolineales bacterium]|nr:hypothetical protein [Anaerolineales bacterium]